MVFKVAVIGAGINGLACATKIKEKYNDIEVVVISTEFSPNITGDGSGGLWLPYLCGKTPGHIITKWGMATYEYLHQLWLEGGHDICLIPILCLYQDCDHWREPAFANEVFGYRKLDYKELDYISKLFNRKYAAGHSFTTFVVPTSTFLSYLYHRFVNAGGECIKAQVNSLRDPALKDYDVVVNCTGLSAKYLVPDDNVFPIRGQVCKVKAPWVSMTVMDEDGENYIIPNANTCVLGGTHQEHDCNTNLDVKDTKAIMEGCASIIPSLKSAEVYNHWVGLRPARHEIRIEAEERDGKLYIHNYGHGGSGFTLFWGCATDVLDQFEKHLYKTANVNSKL